MRSFVLGAAEANDGIRTFIEGTNDIFDTFSHINNKMHEDDKVYITGKIKETMQKCNKAYECGQVEQPKRSRNKIASEIRKEKMNESLCQEK